MTRYFLGVDIGGTKSHALISDESGKALGFGFGGGGNYEGVGYEGFVSTLQKVVHQSLDLAGIEVCNLAGAGFGVAGYDWPSERPLILRALEALALDCPFEVVNDTIVGLLAGSSRGWGVAVVAGTGENCWGWNRERQIGRVTGNGMRMGEFGGASTTVIRAIHEVSKAWSLRGPKTALTEAFINQTGASNESDLLEGLELGKYVINADDARLVFEIAEKGDPVARKVVRWASLELADLAKGVIRQLQFEEESFEVVLVGSMFKGGDLLLSPMREEIWSIAPRARFVLLTAPPVVGGVLLGMECAGMEGYQVRDYLIETTNQLLIEFEKRDAGAA